MFTGDTLPWQTLNSTLILDLMIMVHCPNFLGREDGDYHLCAQISPIWLPNVSPCEPAQVRCTPEGVPEALDFELISHYFVPSPNFYPLPFSHFMQSLTFKNRAWLTSPSLQPRITIPKLSLHPPDLPIPSIYRRCLQLPLHAWPPVYSRPTTSRPEPPGVTERVPYNRMYAPLPCLRFLPHVLVHLFQRILILLPSRIYNQLRPR